MAAPEPRITCCVPGCRRTIKAGGDFTQWVCGKHWPAVPKSMRKRLAKYRRRAKIDARWQGVFCQMWMRCRDRAIEEAFMGF